MNILITGGAGFIGSHLADSLVNLENMVVIIDNLVLGKIANISHLMGNSLFKFVQGDVTEDGLVSRVMREYNIEMVYHLAANSDIQKGGKEPGIDFKDTFLTTRSVLEGMRLNGVKKLFFASTSAVYGERCDVLLTENLGGLSPVSYYGGAKFASEAFISSYASMNDFNVVIFRFPNVIGPRLTHGVIYDFIKKLRNDPTKLEILGDGKQTKQYLYVHDLVQCIVKMTQENNIEPGINIFNVGGETATTVLTIAEIVREKMGLMNARFEFTGGDRGWKGDVPSFSFELAKIHAQGWKAKYTSDEAVSCTVDEVLK